MALIDKLTAIADAIRGKTGKTEEMTLEQMVMEIAGIETGGGGSFGENATTPNFLNLFYALEKGTCVTGEFTLSSYLPNTETLIFDSGLEEIHGIFYVDADWAYTATSNVPEYGVWGMYMTGATGKYDHVRMCGYSKINDNQSNYDVSASVFINRVSSWRIDGGALYATAQHGGNKNYTPFCAGHRYKWVAW